MKECINYDFSIDFSNLTVKEKKNILLSDVHNELHLSEEESDYYKIALSFQALFKSNVQTLGGLTKQIDKINATSIDVVRLMATNDGYDIDDFRKIYTYLRDTPFWHINVRCFIKLRKQANVLLMGYNSMNIKKKPIQDAVASVQTFNRNF